MATVVFFPEGAFGPTNNCVGIGDVLQRRGHRVVFVVEESFAGTLEAQGFEEATMRLGPPPEDEEDAGAVLEGLHPRHRAGLPQADDRTARRVHPPTWQALIDGAKYVEPRLREILGELAARRRGRGQRGGVPRAADVRAALGADRLLQPAGDEGPRHAAVFSGYPWPTAGLGRSSEPSTSGRTGEIWDDFDAFMRERGAPRRCRTSSSSTSHRT